MAVIFFSDDAYAKQITITNSATFPPFSYLNNKGQPEGLLIDLWNEWAQKNHQEIKFILVDWNKSLELVQNGQADIHAGMFESESRKKIFDFSENLFQLSTVLFLSTKSKIQDISELASVEIGVIQGGFEAEYLGTTLKHTNTRFYDNTQQLVASAHRGEIIAFISDYPVGMYFLHRFNAQEKFRLFKTLYSKPLHSAVKKGNSDLIGLINGGLQNIDRDSKERILQKWIRSEPVLPLWFFPLLLTLCFIFLLFCLLFYVHILRRNKKDLKELVTQRTAELEKKNKDLQNALLEVKTLSGLLPICASCKKIRDDGGSWNVMETYIQKYSSAEFSHSMCPECSDKLYGDQEWYKKRKKQK